MGSRVEALALYKSLVRSSKEFATYNFREYFLRRTRCVLCKAFHPLSFWLRAPPSCYTCCAGKADRGVSIMKEGDVGA